MAVEAPERAYTPDVQQPAHRRRAVALGLAGALVAFGLGVATTHVHSPVTPARPTAVAAPARMTNGIPSGWPRTREGAVGAAVDLAPSIQRWALGKVDVAPAYVAGATPDAPAGTLDGLGYASGAKLLLASVPVMYSVVDYSPDRATIDIWLVQVAASSPSSKLPTLGAIWGLGRATVVWESGDWKLKDAGVQLANVPVPSTLNRGFPTAADQAITTLDGFSPFISTAPRP
jgi:hypothetical protein